MLLSPVVMALALAGFSLIFEDIAIIIGIALLHRDASLAVPVFCGLYFGIIFGDVMLYMAGRWLQHVPYIARKLASEKAQIRMNGLRAKLLPMLVMCRAIPASRLPTFLAAGVLRIPIAQFLCIIMLTVAVWVTLVVFVGFNAANAIENYFGFSSGWLLVPIILCLIIVSIRHSKKQKYAVQG
ncbi:MAG: VTT domain-containing protein [Rickettsiales bacterium]|nr:VTT domain-containing protein [Rickettsiales bacterium]